MAGTKAGTKNKRPQGEVIVSGAETLLKQIRSAWSNSVTSSSDIIFDAMRDTETLVKKLRSIFIIEREGEHLKGPITEENLSDSDSEGLPPKSNPVF